MTLPVVAIVGRPNVGKSTLFNRLVGSRLAVVDDHPGITRDRLASRSEWGGLEFHVVDTGGWIPEAEGLDDAILGQVMRAVEMCDYVLFLTDARDGVHPHDREIARQLRRAGVPTLLAANKADHVKVDADVAEFSELGYEPVFPVSAQEARGTGDLLDALVEGLRERGVQRSKGSHTVIAQGEGIRVAIVGRPNVGKSSLVNHLLGVERMIVHDRPGTTRDAVDSPLRYHGRDLILVDTAGIRRRLGNQPQFEFYATLRALRAVDRADVAVLTLDATEPIQRQDARIASLVDQAGRATVVVVNKWDLLEKDAGTLGGWVRRIHDSMPFLTHAPFLFLSALTGQRIHALPEAVVRVYDVSRQEFPTHRWNEALERAVEHNPPRSRGSGMRPAKIYYATQIRTAPPTVAVYVSDPKRMAADYIRYLSGKFREEFGYEGSPIRVRLRRS